MGSVSWATLYYLSIRRLNSALTVGTIGEAVSLKPRDPAFRLQLKPTCKSGSMSYCQKLVLYADDTNIFIIGNDKNNLIQKGNQILKAVNEFMKSNLLHINLDKCYYMHFCPKAVKTKKDNFITEEHESSSLLDLDNTLNISGTSIPEVNNIKFFMDSTYRQPAQKT